MSFNLKRMKFALLNSKFLTKTSFESINDFFGNFSGKMIKLQISKKVFCCHMDIFIARRYLEQRLTTSLHGHIKTALKL